MLINAPDELKAGISHRVNCLVAAAAPPAAVIEGMNAWASTSRTSTG
jgi:fatty-acyl-CoA synthase